MSVASAGFGALGTTATVVVRDPGALGRAVEAVAGVVAAVDVACSRFRDDSELSRANARAGRRIPASALFLDALSGALAAARSTGGAVSPVLGRSLRTAGYDRTFSLVRERGAWAFHASPPPRDAWLDVVVDRERSEALVPVGTELDLGATAKALAADRAAAAAWAATDASVLVSLGGDIAVAGPPPKGGWAIRLEHDHAAPLDGPGPVVAVSSGGLATSSTSVRRWQTDHGPAHHVLDPWTGLPVESPWRTVSVAAATCVDANVAAVASLVFGRSAVGWLEHRGLPARLVGYAGDVATTCGWPGEGRSS